MSREKIDICVMGNCQNLAESYGEICVRCNKCGRSDKEKQIEEMAEMLDIIEKAREEYVNDITDHTENEYIREGLLNANYRKQSEVAAKIVNEFKQIVKQYILDRDLYLVVFKNALDYAEAELKKKYVGD